MSEQKLPRRKADSINEWYTPSCQICEAKEQRETPSLNRCEICWGNMCQHHLVANEAAIPLCSDCYQLITRMFPQILQKEGQ